MASGLFIWSCSERCIRGVVFGEWFVYGAGESIVSEGWLLASGLFIIMESIVSEGWFWASGLFIWSCREYCIRGVAFGEWFVYMEL